MVPEDDHHEQDTDAVCNSNPPNLAAPHPSCETKCVCGDSMPTGSHEDDCGLDDDTEIPEHEYL